RHTRFSRDWSSDVCSSDLFCTEADGLIFDWSKTMIDAGARDLLIELARGAQVEARREAMFSGEKINETEGRAVLHTALRNLDGEIGRASCRAGVEGRGLDG